MFARTTFHPLVAALAVAGVGNSDCGRRGQPTAEPFTVTTLATDLATPWDLVWGPDSMLWVSERTGRISRVDPATGRRSVAGTLDVREWGEGGLMGMALHPDFAREPYV